MDEDLDFGILLALAYSAFVDDLRESLAASGYANLNHSFGYVVRALEPAPLTLRDLARSLWMTSQGALKIVDDMVESGYLERSDDERDARVKLIGLTRKGRRALERARDFHRVFESRLAEQIGPKRAKVLRAGLRAIVEARKVEGVPVSLRPL